MARDLVEAFPSARSVFAEIDDALGFSLSTLCFEGPADQLTETRAAQPALFAHGAAVWSVIREAIGATVVASAGHSLGEFTAYHAAGSFSVSEGAKLVRRRGEIMFQIGTERPGAMAAILGNTEIPIEDICTQASQEAGLVVPANYNSDGQIVISGDIQGVEAAMELAKANGAKRAIRLPVSGAFHSPLMEPAVGEFEAAVKAVSFNQPAFPVYSNVTTQAVIQAGEGADLLVKQLTSPVRWSSEIKNMAATHPGALFVELGPGSVLTGLVPRIVPGAKAIACGTPADVEKLHETLGSHGAQP